jgi:Icc-related predicted phosphoesterase
VSVFRIAAVGDIHFAGDMESTLRPHLDELPDQADALLLAGDLTTCGNPDEAQVLADELRDVGVPVVAVLGNHDHHSDQGDLVRKVLEGADVEVLEGETTVVDNGSLRLGVAGTKGFGGGFAGACATDFGEPEMKAFVRHTKHLAEQLGDGLAGLEDQADLRVALVHYSPVKETLRGERLEIWPFLGSYMLGEAIDHAGADLVVHGHAHHGSEKGVTPGGVPVRNVAQPLIRRAFKILCLSDEELSEPAVAPTPRAPAAVR